MTARFSVKNSHIEGDLIMVLKKTDTCSQRYYSQTKNRIDIKRTDMKNGYKERNVTDVKREIGVKGSDEYFL